MKRVTTTYLTIVFGLCLLLTNCTDKTLNPELSLKKIKEISFDFGPGDREKFSGFFSDESGNTVYYFASPVTGQIIKYFNEEGEYISETSLQAVLNLEEDIDALEIISKDSICILGQYSGNMYLLNHQGEIYFKKSLPAVIQSNSKLTQGGLEFELYASTMRNFISGDHAVVAVIWIPDYKSDSLMSPINQCITRTKIILKYPNLLKLPFNKNDSDQVKSVNLLSQLYSDTTLFYGEAFNHLITDDKILYWSWYSDEVIILDGNSLEILGSKKIKSDYTTVGVKPMRSEDFLKNQNRVNELFKSQGHITGAYYNKKRKHYYFAVLESIDLEKRKELGYTPWSLLIYNEQLELIGEKNYDLNSHAVFLLPVKNGFMLKRILSDEEYSPNKITFDYYEY